MFNNSYWKEGYKQGLKDVEIATTHIRAKGESDIHKPKELGKGTYAPRQIPTGYVIAYTVREGGFWEPLKEIVPSIKVPKYTSQPFISTNADNWITFRYWINFHAFRTSTGLEWDKVNGWRGWSHGEYERAVKLGVEYKQEEESS